MRSRGSAFRVPPSAALLAALATVSLALIGSSPAAHASSRARVPDPAAPTSVRSDRFPISHGAPGRFEPAAAPGQAGVLAFANGLRVTDGAVPATVDPGLTVTTYGDGPSYHLVQFAGPIRAEWRARLEGAGAKIVSYVPNYAYLVRADDATMTRVRGLGLVRDAGLYQPAYKLCKGLDANAAGSRELMVLFFQDEDFPLALQHLTELGAIVHRSSDNGINKLAQITLDGAKLRDLARLREVAWIQPYAMPVIQNAVAQWITQTHVSNNRAIWNAGIRGEGQIVSTSDTGIRPTHQQFNDPANPVSSGTTDYPNHRKLIAYRTMPGATFGDENSQLATYHGTHTGCSIAGDDSYVSGASTNDGMALKAKIYFCDIGTGNAGSLSGIPADFNDLFKYPYTGNTAGHASIMSNSWGVQASAGLQGVYDVEAQQVDQFMWAHKDFLLCFSNGNDGSGLGTVEPPATAKNCISVGATDDTNGNSIASFSSRGPCDDGRVKPTLVTPGNSVNSASGGSNTGYHLLSGTSMACPILAGDAALVRQYLTEGWYPSGTKIAADSIGTPSAALLKAMLISGADHPASGGAMLDNAWGMGRVDLDSLLMFAADSRDLALVENTQGMVTGDYIDYTINVLSSSITLKVALTWTDYPGSPTAATAIVNDLNLSVIAPGGTYLGNVSSGGVSITGGTADVLNVEEVVRLTAPTPGTYTLRVSAQNVPYGPQPFALVATGDLDRQTGFLTLDKPAYGPSELVRIRLEDATPGLVSPVVTFTSTTGDSESVTLTAVAGGVFTGTMPLLFGVITSYDGSLSVTNGDVITARYADAAPVATLSTSALIDATSFSIAAVGASSITLTAATINWTTTDGGSGKVYYGTTTALGSTSATVNDRSTAHAIGLSGLTANTLYFYDVESVDARGNTVRDDNGGRHYTFTTGSVPADVFLVLGNSTYPSDHITRYINAFNRHGWTHAYSVASVDGDPAVGDKTSGLRSYPVVWWNTGLEQYPQVSDNQRTIWQRVHDGGARLAFASHDVSWDFQLSGQDYTAARLAWSNDYLHQTWKKDPDPITFIGGIPGDPISGSYVGGISYTQSRTGAAGDEVAPRSGTNGTAAGAWTDDLTPDTVAVRWTSTLAMGSADSAVWGGTQTKVAAMFFEPMEMNYATVDDQVRSDVVDKTLQWLLGRNHPTTVISSPVGATTYTTSPVTIAWTATADGGNTIASTTLQYSQDLGQTWTAIASGSLTSPYAWDVTGVLNSPHTRVRVIVTDSGSPALHNSATTGDFILARPGGDFAGPIVVAGSVTFTPNPVTQPAPVSITASLTDTTSGGSLIAAAEYSIGASPAAAGSGTALSGAFNTASSLALTGSVPTSSLACATCQLWVRGQDSAGNWGPALATPFVVRAGIVGIGDPLGGPARFDLAQNMPNPFAPLTTIRFSLAEAGVAQLRVFDVNGKLVRTLYSASLPAGPHAAKWDGRDDHGRRVPGGVYFYRLDAPGNSATKKLMKMN